MTGREKIFAEMEKVVPWKEPGGLGRSISPLQVVFKQARRIRQAMTCFHLSLRRLLS